MQNYFWPVYLNQANKQTQQQEFQKLHILHVSVVKVKFKPIISESVSVCCYATVFYINC